MKYKTKKEIMKEVNNAIAETGDDSDFSYEILEAVLDIREFLINKEKHDKRK